MLDPFRLLQTYQPPTDVLYRTHVTSYGSAGAQDSMALFAALMMVLTVAAAIVLLVLIRTVARVQERRIELIRELSAKGQLTPRVLEEHLRPRQFWKNLIFVVAWFALIGGGAMVVLATVNNWRYDWEGIGVAGIGFLVTAFATITAPIALREIRRQGASS